MTWQRPMSHGNWQCMRLQILETPRKMARIFQNFDFSMVSCWTWDVKISTVEIVLTSHCFTIVTGISCGFVLVFHHQLSTFLAPWIPQCCQVYRLGRLTVTESSSRRLGRNLPSSGDKNVIFFGFWTSLSSICWRLYPYSGGCWGMCNQYIYQLLFFRALVGVYYGFVGSCVTPFQLEGAFFLTTIILLRCLEWGSHLIALIHW